MAWLRPVSSCPEDEHCDTASGDCKPIVPECASGQAGDVLCVMGELARCGPDLVTTDTVDDCSDASALGCDRCRARGLIQGQEQPFHLVAGPDRLVWSAADGIWNARLDGTSSGLTVSTQVIQDFAFDGSNVYLPEDMLGPKGKGESLMSVRMSACAPRT